MATDIDSLAVTVILAMQGRSVATAESLTGGQLGSTITAIPGASKIYRGGVIAYASDLKTDLLGVSQSLLAEGGAVQAQVALEMATGAAQRLDAEFGLAVTGVAGPDSQDGHLPGTVFVACIQRDEQIREETVAAALELLLTFL